MCVLSSAPPYVLLAGEDGISAAEMRDRGGLNPGPHL
jgi:hypothetical protein